MKLFIFSVLLTFFSRSCQSPLGHWTLQPHSMLPEYRNKAESEMNNKFYLTVLVIIPTMRPHFCPVLIVEVDGTAGELPLSCLNSSVAADSGSYKHEEIRWSKDGVEEEQRGNTYVVPLLESLGGGNYSCQSSDGSVLNHTVVLVHEDETKRKKILVRRSHGRSLEHFVATQVFVVYFVV